MTAEPFTCPRCRRTSWNPNDRSEGYCGACHDWTGRPSLYDLLAAPADPRAAHRPGDDELGARP